MSTHIIKYTQLYKMLEESIDFENAPSIPLKVNNISRTATMNTLVKIDIQPSGSNAKLRIVAATTRESYRATSGIVYASGLRSMISRAVTGSPVPYIDGTTPGFQTGLVNSINLAGTITSSASTTTITGIASTSALHPGMLLVKNSGTGTFLGAVVTIDSVDSETQITITTTNTSGVSQPNVSGALEFYVRNEYLMTGNTTMYQRDGLGNLYTGTNLVATWGHDQDAGDALQLGGFVFALDGLTAFVSPCGTSVVDYAACT
jgi:hypothetical protein